jgi:predicted phosphodiesterase
VRVAALYDIHGNLPALESVLRDLDRLAVDEIVCGGDLVAGPFPSECLLLDARGARFLLGNADRAVLEAVGDDAWAGSRLTAGERAQVAGWPPTVSLQLDGLGQTLFCHASPRSDEEGITARTRDELVAEAVSAADADVVVCGHTHHQFDRAVGDVRVVNAGSVGLPYEGRAGAYWALLGPDIEHRRSEYDVAAAVEQLVATEYPRVAEYLQISLVEPISRDEAIARMEPPERRGP